MGGRRSPEEIPRSRMVTVSLRSALSNPECYAKNDNISAIPLVIPCSPPILEATIVCRKWTTAESMHKITRRCYSAIRRRQEITSVRIVYFLTTPNRRK